MTGRTAYAAAMRLYAIGFVLSLILTGAAFATVWLAPFETGTTRVVIGLCAVAQVVVQLRCFLHIDHRRQSREDLQLILFTTLILLIMITGTVWVLGSQMARMM